MSTILLPGVCPPRSNFFAVTGHRALAPFQNEGIIRDPETYAPASKDRAGATAAAGGKAGPTAEAAITGNCDTTI